MKKLPSLSCFPDATTRYFSLGRHALVAGLQALGVGPGQCVLLPEYICRDLLASVHAVGADVVFYPVAPNLSPASSQKDWPEAAAVLAVNYFGFPQSLAPFREYCARTGAALIEDNAHGFLSSDEAGAVLGCRGDIGIFSLRKTFLLPNGAALVVPHTKRLDQLSLQDDFDGASSGRSLRIKRILRRLPIVGPLAAAGATRFARSLRRLRTGYTIPPPAPDAEISIPQSPQPYRNLLEDLAKQDFPAEIRRRRALYLEFSTMFRNWDILPVFAALPEHTSPYGFPFRASDDVAKKVRKMAERRGLDAFRWPDLPDVIDDAAPEHYRNTWLLNFLW